MQSPRKRSSEETHSSPSPAFPKSARKSQDNIHHVKKPKGYHSSDSEEDDLSFHSDYSLKSRAYSRQKKAAKTEALISRPWILSPSTQRLHSIEEIALELSSIEAKSEQLRTVLQELSSEKQKLLKQLKDLTETQLEEQLSDTLSKYQEKLSDPTFGLEPKHLCLDCLGAPVGNQDLVEVESNFLEGRVTGRVVQTAEENIALVRLDNTGKVIGTFGSRIRVIEE